MDLKAVVISGEAPESDDDTNSITMGIGFSSIRTPNYCGTIITGEAPESDEDGTSLSSISGAVDAMTCPPYGEVKIPKSKKSSVKYNSLLHKKLRECNETLNKDVIQITEGTVINGIQELSAVNKQLLRSELVLQESVCQLRNASNKSKDASKVLYELINTRFLNSIKT